MRIIPAIDIIDGKCVRLKQGDYSTKKMYNASPLEVAKSFEDSGIEYLHLVDLDGARSGGIVNWKMLNEITSKTTLKIDFGGGLKSDNDVRIAFDNGAQQITGGSIAVQKPNLFKAWLDYYGNERIILGADAKNGKIAINGWQNNTEEKLGQFVKKYAQKGVKYVICTDIEKDGMLGGTSVELYQKLLSVVPAIKLIASGGVAGIDDLDRLYKIGCEGVIIGKALYEQKITLKELELYVN